MGIKTLQNKFNNPIVQRQLKNSSANTYIADAKTIKSRSQQTYSESKRFIDDASDLLAGITPESKELAAISAKTNNSATLSAALSGAAGFPHPINKNKLISAKSIDITNQGSAGSPMPGTGQQVLKLLMYDRRKTNESAKDGLHINTEINDLLKVATWMPMPNEITFDTKINWSAEDAGAIGAKIFNENLNLGNITNVDRATALGADLAKVGINKFNKNILNSATGGDGAYKALEAQSGKVFNPRAEVFFNNITHREFPLTWNLAPQNVSAATNVMALIKALHKAASPSLVENAAFFSYPDLFTLAIVDSTTGKIILDRGVVAITSIECNYTPDGVWACFSSGMPVRIELTLGFIELDLPTAEKNETMLSGIYKEG